MWSPTQKVTFNPSSGRPEAPLYWHLTTFCVIATWVMALILIGYIALAIRDDAYSLAVTCAFAAFALLIIVHWRKRQIREEQRKFNQLVADYEKAISSAV